MRTLVITADDLGRNPQRSHGIFQCLEFGVATGAGLVPNGDDSADAARHARERGFPVGLHIVVTDGYALSRPADIPTLTEDDGRFFSAKKLRSLLDAGDIEVPSLERELRAQVEWCFAHCGPPTHVSSHEDIHLHPAVVEPLSGVLERYGIRYIRVPLEEPLPPFGYEVPEGRLAAIAAMNTVAAKARELYAAHGRVFTDHFRGSTLLGNASLKNLRHVLARLPEGVTELMTHPGSPCAYGTPFDLDPQRQTELQMLVDPSTAREIAERKITLASFADL